MEINNSVAAWSAGLAAQRLPRWDELPDIDLYLDQVLTLLDKYLGPFLPENGGHHPPPGNVLCCQRVYP